MFFRLRKEFPRRAYQLRCRQILSTPPIRPREADVVFASMISHRDLLMYLVAVKSIYRWLDGGRIVLLNDGSLTDQDRDLLDQHLGQPRIVEIPEIDTAVCPRGGCWERLLMVIDLSASDYVVQVDSDLLAAADLPEVRDAIRAKRSFVLGTQMGQALIDLAEAPRVVQGSSSDHIQVVAEKTFAKLADSEKRYVRGCAGFSGFAPRAVSRDIVEAFSKDMEQHLGAKWSEWGSEQVASNYLIANSADPLVLPYPKYANFHPAIDHSETHFFHFIGSHRFAAGRYVSLSRQVIKDLRDGALGS